MQSCRVLKNTGSALRKWELHLVGAYVVTGDNPSPYLVGSGRGVAEDGRWALAADRTSRWFPPQPGKNPVLGDGQEQVGMPALSAAPSARLAHRRDSGFRDFSFKWDDGFSPRADVPVSAACIMLELLQGLLLLSATHWPVPWTNRS